MKMKQLAVACGVCLSLGSSAVVMAENTLSANIGVASNYIWRGTTQTQDDPAVSGGLDYALENGLYVGTWVSNVDFGTSKPNYEWDIYGGYGGEVPYNSLGDSYSIAAFLGSLSYGVFVSMAMSVLLAVKGIEI